MDAIRPTMPPPTSRALATALGTSLLLHALLLVALSGLVGARRTSPPPAPHLQARLTAAPRPHPRSVRSPSPRCRTAVRPEPRAAQPVSLPAAPRRRARRREGDRLRSRVDQRRRRRRRRTRVREAARPGTLRPRSACRSSSQITPIVDFPRREAARTFRSGALRALVRVRRERRSRIPAHRRIRRRARAGDP